MKKSFIRRVALSLCLGTVLATSHSGSAQIYTQNIVGYYLRTLSMGDNLIANQFINRGNSLNEVLTNGVLNGATFTKWNSVSREFLPVSTYDAAENMWSINYTLGAGEGGVLHSLETTINGFVGEVDLTILDVDTITLNWHPNYESGLFLLACPSPLYPVGFEHVVVRAPRDGEWVRMLDETNQVYSVTMFHTGTGWDNGQPLLGIGQAAWFNLAAVPEPSVAALAGLAALGWAARWRGAKSRV